MRILPAIGILISLTVVVFGAPSNSLLTCAEDNQAHMCITPLNEPSQSRPVREAKQGCCSHHGGVCGCGGAKALCCDGATSPTCGC